MWEILALWYENYKITTSSNYSLWTRFDCAWNIYQAVSFIPMLISTIHRFIYQIVPEKYTSKATPLPYTNIEIFVKLNTSFFVVFYLPQTILRLFIPQTFSNVLLIVHHFVTFYGSYNFWKIQYFPWFTLCPLAFHSLWLLLPTATYLYYPYIILIWLCCYGLSMETYEGRNGYKEIQYYIAMWSAVLVVMWAIGFTNEIEVN